MRLAWQILRKDVERLRWAILLAFVLLAIWTYQEAARPAFVWPNVEVGASWLNLGLPFFWSLLIALVIIQDPLAGDRQFWVALPCGRGPLALAKTALIVASINVPYFLATSAILIARGFNPLEHLPHLFWKQFVLLGFMLPAIAVVAVVKNISQYLLVVITVAAGFIFLNNRVNRPGAPDNFWDVRWTIALVTLALGALVVALLQFAKRSTNFARAVALLAFVAAAGLYNELSRDTSAALKAAIEPAPPGQTPISAQLDNSETRYTSYDPRLTTVAIPISFTQLPTGAATRFDQISLNLILPSGERVAADWPTSNSEFWHRRILTSIQQFRPGSYWLVIQFYDAAVWKRVRSAPITLESRILASFHQPGRATTLVPNQPIHVNGLGNCTATARDGTDPYMRVETIACESPEYGSREMGVGPAGAAPMGLGYLRRRDFFDRSPFPHDPWLSPLHRVGNSVGRIDGQWAAWPLLPRGNAIVDLTLRNLDLNSFKREPPK